MSCKHQWFETRKIQGFSKALKKKNDEESKKFLLRKENHELGEYASSLLPFFSLPDKYGVRVVCANIGCGITRDIWEKNR